LRKFRNERINKFHIITFYNKRFRTKKFQRKIKAFSKEALAQKIVSLEGKKLSVSDVIKKHEGRILIIDFWASWCRDCILALPSTKELKEKNPEIDFVYFSLDRSHEQWKKGLEKYNISANENYWFDEGWKIISIIIST
jgi:hypothetical protein